MSLDHILWICWFSEFSGLISNQPSSKVLSLNIFRSPYRSCTSYGRRYNRSSWQNQYYWTSKLDTEFAVLHFHDWQLAMSATCMKTWDSWIVFADPLAAYWLGRCTTSRCLLLLLVLVGLGGKYYAWSCLIRRSQEMQCGQHADEWHHSIESGQEKLRVSCLHCCKISQWW